MLILNKSQPLLVMLSVKRKKTNKGKPGAGEMAQQALPALPEVLSSIPSKYMLAPNQPQ